MSALQAYKDLEFRFKPTLAPDESVKLTLYMNRCDNEMSDERRLFQQYIWKLDCRWDDDSCGGYYVLQWNPDTSKFDLFDNLDYRIYRGINWELVDQWRGIGKGFLSFLNKP